MCLHDEGRAAESRMVADRGQWRVARGVYRRALRWWIRLTVRDMDRMRIENFDGAEIVRCQFNI